MNTPLRWLAGLLIALPLAGAQERAPDFSLTDTEGRTHSRVSCEGSVTVLEWVNFDCPFVQKYYSTGALPAFQKRFTGRGVKWFSIASNSAGQPGHLEPSTGRAALKEAGARPTALLLDADGAVAKAFGARRTPHVVILDANSRIVYRGGYDNELSFDPARVNRNSNFVTQALEEVLLGKPVSRTSARSQGCSIR